jgi:hypothetical protein
VSAVTPALDRLLGQNAWSIDVAHPAKLLTTNDDLDVGALKESLAKLGYKLLDEQSPLAASPDPSFVPSSSIGPLASTGAVQAVQATKTPVTWESESTSEPTAGSGYRALLLIVGYIVAVCAMIEWANPPFSMARAMASFMAGFFLVFSFFKFLDLTGFARSYAMYDLVAARIPGYGFIYPFLELGLGLAYVARVWPTRIHVATLILMLIGLAGVISSMLNRKKVRCACLGTLINLPVSTITLAEDGLMAIMAASSLLMT